jgi:hypothetical protein
MAGHGGSSLRVLWDTYHASGVRAVGAVLERHMQNGQAEESGLRLVFKTGSVPLLLGGVRGTAAGQAIACSDRFCPHSLQGFIRFFLFASEFFWILVCETRRDVGKSLQIGIGKVRSFGRRRFFGNCNYRQPAGEVNARVATFSGSQGISCELRGRREAKDLAGTIVAGKSCL